MVDTRFIGDEINTKRMEEYLEVIHELEQEKNIAKIKDVSEILSVKSSTVIEMFKKLAAMGLINYERYKGATLTNEGRSMVNELVVTHEKIQEFLVLMGLDKTESYKEACKIEHLAVPKTINLMTTLFEFFKNNPRCLNEFLEYKNKKEQGL